MSTPTGPHQESSYPMDAENVAEMSRLIKQATMATENMGLFPPSFDPAGRRNILDIGCGPGEWVLKVAKLLPESQLTGIDISHIMTQYARFSARDQNIHNAQFFVKDTRQPLDFPDASFDIIHSRFLTSFLTPATWLEFLRECFRLLRPGGIVINAEFEGIGITTSLSLTRYNSLMIQALRRAGRCFTPEGDSIGITAVQPRLLQQAGFRDIHCDGSVGNYSTGMPTHDVMYDDLRTMLKMIQPFLVDVGLATQEELDILYVRAMEDVTAKDFCASNFVQRVWGIKPE
jgi:ubiquinone/menaquinone biosynthesis C-methylase UbiE